MSCEICVTEPNQTITIFDFYHRSNVIRFSGARNVSFSKEKEKATIWNTALKLKKGNKNDEDGNAELLVKIHLIHE